MKFVLFASLSLSLIACGSKQGSSQTPAPTASTQIANPASGYCVELGGTLEMRTSDGGEAGWCIKDSHACDEWALFRGECPEIGPASPAATAE